MTVRELRLALDNFEDEAEVFVEYPVENGLERGFCTLSAAANGEDVLLHCDREANDVPF